MNVKKNLIGSSLWLRHNSHLYIGICPMKSCGSPLWVQNNPHLYMGILSQEILLKKKLKNPTSPFWMTAWFLPILNVMSNTMGVLPHYLCKGKRRMVFWSCMPHHLHLKADHTIIWRHQVKIWRLWTILSRHHKTNSDIIHHSFKNYYMYQPK